MKTVVLFLMVVFVIVPSTKARAVTCTQAVQNANNLAASIASAANNYWSHKQNFIEYTYGKKHNVANWKTLATAEKSAGAQFHGPMPNALASFQAAVATVRALNCVSEANLQALIEATTTQVRTVNFDHFPEAED